MKTAKLVLGIISIVYSVIVFLQTSMYDIVDYIGEGLTGLFSTGRVSFVINILISSGYIAAVLMLAGGITSIAARKSYGGAIACTVLFALAGAVAYSGIIGYILEYRVVPAFYCLLLTLFYGVSLFAQRYDDKQNIIEDSTEENIETF